MITAEDVVVTVLTGHRPRLLELTLAALEVNAPGLLASAYTVVLHNGDDGSDEETRELLDLYAWAWDELHAEPELLPVGPATSRLATRVVPAWRAYWLHLEDDWGAAGAHPGWLDRARELLATDPELAQVRLRRASEPVLRRHMVTRRPLRWEDRGDHQVARDAHWTNNPALVRALDAGLAYPADGEREAQRNWRRAGRRKVAQLVPGEFVHLGDDASLRVRTGSPL